MACAYQPYSVQTAFAPVPVIEWSRISSALSDNPLQEQHHVTDAQFSISVHVCGKNLVGCQSVKADGGP